MVVVERWNMGLDHDLRVHVDATMASIDVLLH